MILHYIRLYQIILNHIRLYQLHSIRLDYDRLSLCYSFVQEPEHTCHLYYFSSYYYRLHRWVDVRKPGRASTRSEARGLGGFESPEFAQLEPSRKAPEARCVGVAQTLQNKRKSIKMIIYSHSKRPES